MDNTKYYKKLKIVNPELRFKKVSLIEPTEHTYLLLAAEVDKSKFSLFLLNSNKKTTLLELCKKNCKILEREADIISAVVFEAALIPPGKGKFLKQREDKVHIAKFDLVILIEAKSQQRINELQSHIEFKNMEKELSNCANYYYSTTASNIKNIGAVDHQKQGVFLFNYFFADNLQQNIDVWEYTAGWFQQETGLDNSTVLLPIEYSQYTIINHCRWDKWTNIIPSLIFKKSFSHYVLENFYANNVAAIPILYKMA